MSSSHNEKEEVKSETARTRVNPLLLDLDTFLSDLECVGEMVSLVLPVLKNRDHERATRIQQLEHEIATLSEQFEDGHGNFNLFQFATDLKEYAGHLQKIQQGDRMFRQSMVTSVVSKLDEFVVRILKVCYGRNPGWLKNPEKKLSYKEILEIESLESLKTDIISREVDSIMRDSHHAQLTFLNGKLKLGIEQEFPFWGNFLEITERRNIFIHAGGKASIQYLENCRRWNIPVAAKVKEGSYLSATDEYIKTAIDCFYELGVRLGQGTVRRLFPESLEQADQMLNLRSVDLLTQEKWDLAERIFTFALNIPDGLKSKGEFNYFFLINACIAKKFAGKPFSELLNSVDWSPFHPKYHLAVAILEDRFADAEKLMRTQAVQDGVKEMGFKEWPLFREFRKTEAFHKAFHDIYKKDYSSELLQEAEKEIHGTGDSDSNSQLDAGRGIATIPSGADTQTQAISIQRTN